MRRSGLEPFMLALLPACAFGDGQPWGQADLRLEAAFTIPTERATDHGRLLTANDYELEIRAIVVTTERIGLTLAPEGMGLGFDPSSPPAGYSLCHNGHCHADDGRLVSYEEIAIDLGGSSTSAFTTGSATIRDPIELIGIPFDVPLAECPEACRLERGALRSVSLELQTFGFSLVARDLRKGDRRRLSGPVAVTATLPFGTTLERRIGGAVDRGEPIGVLIRARFAPPPSTFDDVDWSAMTTTSTVDLSGSRGLAALIQKRFQEDEALTATVERFDVEGEPQ